MLETVLKTGGEAGFATVEAFAVKVLRRESSGTGPELSRHEAGGDRLLARAFRESGEPLGFSLSAPDARQVRRSFADLASGSMVDRRKNFAHLLPKSAQKVKLDIFDAGIEPWEGGEADDLRERVRECLLSFPALKLKKFQFSKELRKVYLANTRGFFAKYRKTLFQVQLSFMSGDLALELGESRVHLRDLDPQRLVSRAANLLGALEAERGEPAADSESVLMSPEAAAQMLKEFSPGLRLDRPGPRGRGIAASSRVSILDNPSLDGQSGSVPFDDEGTPATETYLVNKGVAVGAVADIRSAFERGGASTGNGFRDERGIFPAVQFSNLFIKPGNAAFDQVLRRAGKGILVFLVRRLAAGRLPGESVFSAHGYHFAGGEITRPVHFHFATTMRSYFLHILEVSRELRFFQSRANFGSPYLLLAGKPDAGRMFAI
jgi:predicted Zn-dependent protease